MKASPEPRPSKPTPQHEQRRPHPPDDVLLFYDEQRIGANDDALSKLCAIVARSVPEEKWASVPATRGQYLWGVASKYLLSSTGLAKTKACLVSQIKHANNLHDDHVHQDTTLKIPPVPVRGYTDFNYPTVSIRTYRPSTKGYAAADDVSSLTFSDDPVVAKVTEMDRERSANLTVVELATATLTQGDRRSIRELPFPPGVIALSKRGYTRVRLLQSAVGPCPDPAAWLDSSPYTPRLRKKLASLTEEAKRAILEKAAATPLLVVDWDTEISAAGHGSKVISTIGYLLHNLALDFLNRETTVKAINLNPGTPSQKQALLSLLAAYQDYLVANNRARADILAPIFKPAQQWVKAASLPAGQHEYDVPDLVVQVIFWRLSRSPSWANMSVALLSPVLDTVTPDFINAMKSFVVLAAGNDHMPLTHGTSPQDRASHLRNMVNVTFGNSDGKVLGAFGDVATDTVVSLVAPGCGFVYGTLNTADFGSSFASPYVATAAWLKYLIDDVSVEHMRLELLQATHPLPRQSDPIESGGVFDPARLLSTATAHFVDHGMNLTDLRSGEVRVELDDSELGALSLDWKIGDPRIAGRRALTVLPVESGFAACVRMAARTDSLPQLQILHGRIRALHATLTGADGTVLPPIDTPADFVARVTELVF